MRSPACPQQSTRWPRQIRRARAATADLTGLTQSLGPQVHQLTDYLQEIGTQFQGSAAGGFYMPQRALADPRLRAALDKLMSHDGRATYLLVYGDGHEWGDDGAQRARQIETAVHEATKEGTLTPTAVYIGGVGPTTLDLQNLVNRDVKMLMAITLVLIFLIVALMLRSPVAGVVVVGTVAVSYASALGASILISAAPAASRTALGGRADLIHRAGGSRGRLQPVAGHANSRRSPGRPRHRHHPRVRRNRRGGHHRRNRLRHHHVRTRRQQRAQRGSDRGDHGGRPAADTLVVRTFVLPSIVALLGRWFWWPTRISRKVAEPKPIT